MNTPIPTRCVKCKCRVILASDFQRYKREKEEKITKLLRVIDSLEDEITELKAKISRLEEK